MLYSFNCATKTPIFFSDLWFISFWKLKREIERETRISIENRLVAKESSVSPWKTFLLNLIILDEWRRMKSSESIILKDITFQFLPTSNHNVRYQFHQHFTSSIFSTKVFWTAFIQSNLCLNDHPRDPKTIAVVDW